MNAAKSDRVSLESVRGTGVDARRKRKMDEREKEPEKERERERERGKGMKGAALSSHRTGMAL